MTRPLRLALLLWCLPALAQEPAAPAKPAGDKAPADMMMGWKPPKLKSEAQDRKEITALLGKMEAAGKKGDLEAAAAILDFPVLMVTDDSKGEAGGESWDREKWTQAMKPFYEHPMAGMQVVHHPTITVLTDSLASATDAWTMTMGKKKVSARSAMLLVRKGGEWKVKAMVEGGWGDMPMGGQAGGGTGGTQ